jgi:hypothetical protein
VLLAVRVSTLVVVVGLGLNAAVTPGGSSFLEEEQRVKSWTLPVNPFWPITVIVDVPDAP